jgi:hypothetical protein
MRGILHYNLVSEFKHRLKNACKKNYHTSFNKKTLKVKTLNFILNQKK